MMSAALCRKRGWRPGTLLRGVEFGVAATIQVTAVGTNRILARRVDGDEIGYECAWTLGCRKWTKVGFRRITN